MHSMMSYDKRTNIILKHRVNNLLILSKLLMLVPYLQCLALTGSMARGDTNITSDIDLMFIVKSGRIFTTRFIISAILYITGLKRGPKDVAAHGKFCPNYYTTSNYLFTPMGRGEDMDRYCAENYSKSVFLGGDDKIFQRFLDKNRRNWQKYLNYSNYSNEIPNPKSQIHDTCYMIHDTFPISAPRSFDRIRQTFERILSRKLGDRLEEILKRIQLKKINSDPRTKKYPDLIVANDKEMRAHPPKIGSTD